MTRYRIVHTTRYEFEGETASCTLEARLRARSTPGQACRFHQLVVRPLTGKRQEARDGFGNLVAKFTVPASHQTLEVSAINLVETYPRKIADIGAGPSWESARVSRQDKGGEDLSPFLTETPLTACGTDLAVYARASFAPKRPVLSAACDLMHRIHADFAYRPGATGVDTTAAEAARLGKGVCQDFAHIGIACLRSLGLAARYVSGYLDTSAAKVANAAPGGDASHAWFALHVPGLGWIDFDPTNDRIADSGYVTLAWGRDYRDVAPLRGAAAGGGPHKMWVSVDMARDDTASENTAA